MANLQGELFSGRSRIAFDNFTIYTETQDATCDPIIVWNGIFLRL